MVQSSLERILKEHSFLAGLDPAHTATLVSCASNRRFGTGEYLAREGEQADAFYLIRSGKVALQIYGAQRGSVWVDTLEEGDILGWSWLIAPYRWHFDAVAVEPGLAIALDGKCLRNKCEQDHELGYQLLKRFAALMEQRLSATRLQVLDMYGA